MSSGLDIDARASDVDRDGAGVDRARDDAGHEAPSELNAVLARARGLEERSRHDRQMRVALRSEIEPGVALPGT